MRLFLARLFAVILLAAMFGATRAEAQDQAPDLRSMVNALAAGGFAGTAAAGLALGATGDPAVAPILETLAAGDL